MSGGAVHAEDEAKKAEEYLLGKAFEVSCSLSWGYI